ncbi:MAG: glycoside hydrolase family 16 protein [Burkholderiaceae bacterium]
MSKFASNPVREKNPNGVRQQSAKSTVAIIGSIVMLTGLSACGEVSNWWHDDKIPNPGASGGSGVQTAGLNNESAAGTSTNTGEKSGSGSASDNASIGNATASAASSATTPVPTTTANSGTATAGSGTTGDFKPAGYDTLFFSDEFNGTELDRSKWCTRFVWGGGPELQIPDAECTKFSGQGTLDYANADEQQRYRDINTKGEPLHVLNNGILELRATKTGTDWYLQYEAAMLNSKMTFKPEGNTSYYITTRMRLPNVLGTWPSIWLAPSLSESGAAQWPPEIDIFEGPLNNNPETEFTLHQHSQVRGAQTDSGKYEFTEWLETFDTTWGYYTSPTRTLRNVWLEIAAKWTVDGVCFYIDGMQTACENYRWVGNDGAPGHPANLILNLAIGGPWAGRGGIDAASFPTQLEVDYVRVYRKN